MEAELARSRQREKLKAEMEQATSELTKTQPAKVANSDAKALSRYLAALGADISPDRLNDLLVLLAVIMIEAGGELSLALGMSLSEGGVRSGRSERLDGQGKRSPAERRTERRTEQPNEHAERTDELARRIKGFDRSPSLNKGPGRSAHERVLSALR